MWLLQNGHSAAAEVLLAGEGGVFIGGVAHRLTRQHLQYNLEAGLRSLAIMDQG